MLELGSRSQCTRTAYQPSELRKKLHRNSPWPLLVEGNNVGVVVIGAPLVDAILGFKNISGADIGLLIKDQDDAVEE